MAAFHLNGTIVRLVVNYQGVRLLNLQLEIVAFLLVLSKFSVEVPFALIQIYRLHIVFICL